MTIVNNYTSLLSGHYWTPTFQQRAVILTYSFVSKSAAGNPDPEKSPFVAAIDAAHQDLVRAALKSWGDSSGIIFLESKKSEGDLNFGVYTLTADRAGDAGLPGSGAFLKADGSLAVFGGSGETNSGVVRFAPDTMKYSNSSFTHVALHEIGHALGLKHPHDTDPNITLDPALDNGANTVMSYKDYLPSLGKLDIDAIQALYGNAAADASYPFAWSWDAGKETLRQTGTAGADYIKGSRANDVIDSAGGHDAIVTYAGNDVIMASGQSLQVNAGTGLDFVNNAVSRSSVTQLHYEKQNSYVFLRFGAESQQLVGVERLGFSDGTLAFDIDGNAGQAYRIYQAAFDRKPDASGLSFWIKAIDSGSSLLSVASGFIASQEFASVYGGIESNLGFVSKLYKNVLHRDGEAGGVSYWNDQLNSGISKAQVLAGFSESSENMLGTASAISDGIWYT